MNNSWLELLTVPAEVACVSTIHKKRFGQPKSRVGRLARVLSVSLYPTHLQLVARRERELNLHRSTIFQVLLEAEQRENIIRRELLGRLGDTDGLSTTLKSD